MNSDEVLYIRQDGATVRIPRAKLPEDAENKHYAIGFAFYEDGELHHAIAQFEELEVWSAPGVTLRAVDES